MASQYLPGGVRGALGDAPPGSVIGWILSQIGEGGCRAAWSVSVLTVVDCRIKEKVQETSGPGVIERQVTTINRVEVIDFHANG